MSVVYFRTWAKTLFILKKLSDTGASAGVHICGGVTNRSADSKTLILQKTGAKPRRWPRSTCHFISIP